MGEIPRNEIAVAIVLAVNWPPHAPAPGHAPSSSSVDLLRGHFSCGESAGRFEYVLNRDIVALKSSGHDRAAIERQPG